MNGQRRPEAAPALLTKKRSALDGGRAMLAVLSALPVAPAARLQFFPSLPAAIRGAAWRELREAVERTREETEP
jgi:hypothetical protein